MRFSTNTTGANYNFQPKSVVYPNHLGNVLTVLTDRKIAVVNSSAPTIDHFTSEILTANDYYSFGFEIKGRAVNSGNSYRYGMNTQEKDNEIFDGATTAEHWEYDSRLGRRWNLDPMPVIGISAYSAFLNNPILFNDPNGDVVEPLDGQTKKFLEKQSAANPAVQAELNAQQAHTTNRNFTRADGTTYSQKATPVYYRYSVNKTSNKTFQQALAYHTANRLAGGANFNSSANYFSFNIDKTENISSFGQGSATNKENNSSTSPKRITTEDTYRDYNINLKFNAGHNDPDNDRVRIYQGTTLIYDSNKDKDFGKKDADGFSTIKATNIATGVTNPDGSRGKISIKITNGDTQSDSKPGAYVIKGTIKGF